MRQPQAYSATFLRAMGLEEDGKHYEVVAVKTPKSTKKCLLFELLMIQLSGINIQIGLLIENILWRKKSMKIKAKFSKYLVCSLVAVCMILAIPVLQSFDLPSFFVGAVMIFVLK